MLASQPEPQPDRLLSIDCLRGAAALAVFVFHVSNMAGFDKRTLPPFHLLGHTFSGILSPLTLGASGVNLFFVISGFCLALQQWRSPRRVLRGPALRRYAQNRVARIVPAYWLTVLLSAAVVWRYHDVTAAWLGREVLVHLLFLHGTSPGHFMSLHGGLWSMATEVEFYLLFPLLLLLYDRRGGPVFAGLMFLVDLGTRLVLAYHPHFRAAGAPWAPVLAYQIGGRIFEFALGMALASIYLLRQKDPPRVDGWARACRLALLPALLLALWGRGFGPPFLPDLCLGLFYFVLCGVILLGAPGQWAGPRWEWAGRFGRASYSFFLIHYPVLFVLSRACPLPQIDPWGRFFFLFFTALPLSSLCAVALYLGIELPLWRRLRASGQKSM